MYPLVQPILHLPFAHSIVEFLSLRLYVALSRNQTLLSKPKPALVCNFHKAKTVCLAVWLGNIRYSTNINIGS